MVLVNLNGYEANRRDRGGNESGGEEVERGHAVWKIAGEDGLACGIWRVGDYG